MMKRPFGIMAFLTHSARMPTPMVRRTVLAIVVALCLVLTLFPERYRAAVSLTPTEPSSLGLSGTLSQLGAVGSVFGNQAAVEVSLKIARSDYVRALVTKQLDLERRFNRTPLENSRWLRRNISVRALRGGIIEFETTLRDPKFAHELIAAYGEAVREQLAVVSRNQTAYKRKVLVDLVEQSSERLAEAQSKYDLFRLRTRYSSPQAAIGAVGDRIPKLEDTIKSKQVALNAARQFATDDNLTVREIMAEISALQRQLAQARSTSPSNVNSVGRVIKESTEVDRLRRNLDIALTLYESYKRYLQGTAVEDLTSTANVRILEPAYIDTTRQYNWTFALIGLFVAAFGLAMEFYLLRPPVGEHGVAK